MFIRFGNIPKNKRSAKHASDAILGYEKGVSVWNCTFANDVPFPLLPNNYTESCVADFFYLLFSNKPVYLVNGTVIGTGGDGEPLLGKDIHIIKEITNDYAYLKEY